MKFGIVGLGRMGGSLALQALEKDHEVVGYSKPGEKKEFADAGVSFAELPRRVCRGPASHARHAVFGTPIRSP